jgi:uncharacterized peroxidase-related enzyme
MGLLIRAALKVAPQQVRGVTPVRPNEATGLVADVYAQVVRDFGVLAPPARLHSPSPDALAAAWVILRETLVAAGHLDRATKEIVAAAVSLGNSCPYCVEVHGATFQGLRGDRDATALVADRLDAITDPRVRELAEWARVSGNRELVAQFAVPVTDEQVPELIGTAVTFQYYNRMVSAFLVDSPFPPGVPASALGRVRKVFGRLMRPAAGGTFRPGDALELLPAAPVPADLGWAAASPAIADAFARAGAAVDRLGERVVPDAVRRLVTTRLATWTGQPVGISRGWVDEPVAQLDPADRAAGRLALLVAFAPYQVDDAVVAAVRDGADGADGAVDDEAVVGLVAWSALTTSRRVGSWLWEIAGGGRPAAAA